MIKNKTRFQSCRRFPSHSPTNPIGNSQFGGELRRYDPQIIHSIINWESMSCPHHNTPILARGSETWDAHRTNSNINRLIVKFKWIRLFTIWKISVLVCKGIRFIWRTRTHHFEARALPFLRPWTFKAIIHSW